MADDENAERWVLEIGKSNDWDTSPYTIAVEMKRLLGSIIDSGTAVDSGLGSLFPLGASEPIAGHSEASLYAFIEGKEFYITIRKSNQQLIKDGVTKEELGL